MLHAALSAKSHTLKSVQSQASKPSQANERPQGAFESMLDDNAAQASAAAKDTAAKDKDQAAAADRTQKGAAPKAKSDKNAADTKPAADQPPTKVDAADKSPDAGKTEMPVTIEMTGEADTEVPLEATPDTTTAETDTTTTETPVMPDVTGTVSVVPVQPLATLPDTQPAPPEAAEEAVTQAPVIAAVGAQKPLETSEAEGKADNAGETGKPAAKEQPAKAEQVAEGTQTAAQPEEQGQAEKGKAPHVALSDAEKEHIARARGEGTEKTEHAAAHAKSEPADTGTTVQKTTPDVPTQQVQAPASTTNPVSSAATAANPQATAQTTPTVPLSAVGIEIASKATSGKKEFEIRLDPPELGRIEVRLNVDRDGNVTSRLIADRQDTLDLLKRDSSGLERALQDAGLKTSDNGMQFSLRDQSSDQQQSDNNSNSRTAHVLMQDDTLPTIDVPAQSYGRLAGRAGGLDIRV